MPDNVFEYAIAPNALIEAARYVMFLGGFVLFCAGLHQLLTKVAFWDAILAMSLGLFTSVQELTVLGQPFYPWRLTLLIVMCVSCWMHLYRSVPRDIRN